MSHFINNHWTNPNELRFKSHNPANEELIWEGGIATANEVNQAVLAARAAHPKWAETPFEKRLSYLEKFQNLLSEKQSYFSLLISKETGKSLWECKGEVGAMIGKFASSLKAYQARCQEESFPIGEAEASTRFKPHGVIAILGPFNFPGHLPNGHIMPALIAGNTIVFKPSELTPKVGEEMIRLWQKTGLPPGVINLVQGEGPTGKLLVEHNEIDAVCFTGSLKTGKQIMASLVESPQKLLALEMGGNNPLIVHQCRDLKAAAQNTIMSAYISSGQRCSCARRLILVKGEEADSFLEQLIPMIRRLTCSPPAENKLSFMGTLISKEAAQHTLNYQRDLIKKGASALIESKLSPTCPTLVSPGLIDVSNVNRHDEECFGPLLSLIQVDSFEEAIQEANKTKYGLAASIFTDQKPLWETFYRTIRAGVVNWNRQTTGASGSLPFGGIGQSGNHRPSGAFACDYCSYPVASLATPHLTSPALPEGITL